MEAILIKSQYEIERNKPMPSLNHGIVQANIIGLFFLLYFKQYRLISELSTKLDEQKQVPDIAIYSKDNINVQFNALNDQITTSEVPLCTIEILSPTQSLSELTNKAKRYFKNGVQSYWLILPEMRTIYVFSSIDEYEVYSKEEILLDKVLNVELKLTEVFS